MSEIRAIHEVPIHILQEFIIIIRTNEKFIGEGKVEDYYIIKNETSAAIIYDNNKISYIANFTKDSNDNWFFNSRMTIRDSLKGQIKKDILKRYFPDETKKEDGEKEKRGKSSKKKGNRRESKKDS